jgi:hypothetical protein
MQQRKVFSGFEFGVKFNVCVGIVDVGWAVLGAGGFVVYILGGLLEKHVVYHLIWVPTVHLR